MLCALFAGVFRYVDQHFHTPETFFENNSELATNADIRERLLTGFRDEIIEFADGPEEEEDEADSPGIILDIEDDVTSPITQERNERNEAIDKILRQVFDTDEYYDAFNEALANTQSQVVRAADLEPEELLNDKGDVYFNMRRLYESIWPALAQNESTSSLTVSEPPPEYGRFKVADRSTTVSFLWGFVQSGPGLRSAMTAFAVMSFIGAVAIAERRPSTAIQFGGGMVGVGVVLIVVIFLIRFIVPLLAGGGSSASPVVATYVANTWPLVQTMIRLVIFGVVIAVVGGIARLIWPDDWVYSSVSDERGVRSLRRRRGAPEPEAKQVPVAAAVPVGYPGYPQQPYQGYPQQWGQPYPGQYPPPGYAPYPVGPYAQAAPAQAAPGQPQQQPAQQQQSHHYTSPGKPTVPVMPVSIDAGDGMVPPAAPPLDRGPTDLPADAAQVVPRVVATTDTTLDASAAAANAEVAEVSDKPTTKDTVVEPSATFADSVASSTEPDAAEPTDAQADANDDTDDTADTAVDADEWAAEKDW